MAVLPDESVQMVVTSPPYSVVFVVFVVFVVHRFLM